MLLAQRTSEGVFWYYRGEYWRRVYIQDQIVQVLSAPVADREWGEESAVPLNTGLLLAAALLVGVPFERHPQEDQDPITGLDCMSMFRWVWKFLVRHHFVHPPLEGYPHEPLDIPGEMVGSSRAEPGDILYVRPPSGPPQQIMIVLSTGQLLGIPYDNALGNPVVGNCVHIIDRSSVHSTFGKRVFIPHVRPTYQANDRIHRAVWAAYRDGVGARAVEELF